MRLSLANHHTVKDHVDFNRFVEIVLSHMSLRADNISKKSTGEITGIHF